MTELATLRAKDRQLRPEPSRPCSTMPTNGDTWSLNPVLLVTGVAPLSSAVMVSKANVVVVLG